MVIMIWIHDSFRAASPLCVPAESRAQGRSSSKQRTCVTEPASPGRGGIGRNQLLKKWWVKLGEKLDDGYLMMGIWWLVVVNVFHLLQSSCLGVFYSGDIYIYIIVNVNDSIYEFINQHSWGDLTFRCHHGNWTFSMCCLKYIY